jgi:hypothetical protein
MFSSGVGRALKRKYGKKKLSANLERAIVYLLLITMAIAIIIWHILVIKQHATAQNMHSMRIAA